MIFGQIVPPPSVVDYRATSPEDGEGYESQVQRALSGASLAVSKVAVETMVQSQMS